MRDWISTVAAETAFFMPHGHCYLWIPSLLWLHVVSDVLIGVAYVGIALLLLGLVRRLRLPFSPVFLSFGLFIALCGGTHFMEVWNVWQPDYWAAGFLKAGTALASVATAIGLLVVKPRIQLVIEAARLSEERRIRLESAHAELESVYGRLKEADAFRSRFFANVSHELRTPLTLIVGPARTLQEADNLTAAQRRALDGICDNGASLLRQVDELLDLARIDADRMTLAHADVDLVPWSRALVSHFESVAEQRGLALAIETPPTLVARVDAGLLSRTYVNLLSNAIKYTPPGGTIVTTVASRDGSAIVSVADDGPGVPESQREAIFERFHRGDATTSRRATGAGLGLAIARDLAELHGGRLTVGTSSLGGALFLLTVPLQPPAGVETDPAASTAFPASLLEGVLAELAPAAVAEVEGAGTAPPDAPRVLVVEDDPPMRRFVADVLSGSFAVTTAADGVEGLATIGVLRPDVVVTDIAMPHLSGDEMCRAMRRDPTFDTIPLLMLTARADDALRVSLLGEGAQDYLVKPFLPAELVARVRNLASTKRAGDTLRATLSSLSGDLEGLAREISIKNRHLESALAGAEVAREQAEGASLVKSSFLGLVSHEIRTPLAAILMNLELLSRQREVALAADVKRKVDRLTVAAKQLNTLMEGLLEYTRFERAGIEADIGEIDPRAVAREVVDEYALLLETGAIRLTFVDDGQALPLLHTDGRLLRVMVRNLVNNAVKFTERGSVKVRVAAAGDDCAIEVVDTGPGIPAASLARIFLPFEQLEPLHRKSSPGVGLGLALVNQIAVSLRGRIEVDSEEGVGSTFRILLPFSAPPATPPAAASHRRDEFHDDTPR